MPDGTRASRDEVVRAIDALTHAELLMLKHFAIWRVRGLGRASCGRTWEDLLGEAKVSTWEGAANNGKGRRWNKDVDFVTHLTGAMRSISSHWKRDFSEDEAHLESEVMTQSDEDVWISPLDNAMSDDASQEQYLLAREVLHGFSNRYPTDFAAIQVLAGLCKGLTASEIMEKSELTKSDYQQAVKRIRRCLRRWELGARRVGRRRPKT
jgi:hypothetical protein